MKPKSTPILTLTTKRPPAPTIKIDGKAYPLRHADDLGVLGARFRQTVKKLIAIEGQPLLTAEDQQVFDVGAHSACSIILDAPAAVIDKLTVSQQVSVVRKYLEGLPDAPKAAK